MVGSNFYIFRLILLLKTLVIITIVYVLLDFHNRDKRKFSIQAYPESLSNWTQGHLERYWKRLSGKNSTGTLGESLKGEHVLNHTKHERFKKMKKRNKTKDGKREVLIFVGIVSAPQKVFRRNAVRRSWLKECKDKGIPCLFFTDYQDMHGNKLPEHIYVPLHQEQLLHGDMILAQSPGGINFARRYLWMLNWANVRYKFKYFLRIDDDYFVCMDRLLLELPHRPKEKLYWGHVHCSPPGKTLTS